MHRALWVLVLLASLSLSCRHSSGAVAAERSAPPRNIVLMVGDGMGAAHFTAAHALRGEAFAAGRFPVTGLVSTRSASSLVTDSAAAATAMATGVKTNNRGVGVDVDGSPVTTLLELAEDGGKASGLVTTSVFWDATPAAFAAHTTRREDSPGIVRQLLASRVDLLAGGGAERFATDGMPALSEAAGQHGWSVVSEPASLDSAPLSRVLAVFPSHPADGDAAGAPLSALARWALDRLQTDPDGFFLLVEHEGTDRASHLNAPEDLRASLRSFDEAVAVVADFARSRGDTLVLVLGDHETSGLRVVADEAGALSLEFSSQHHTGSLVPLFALGPRSEQFTGYYENTAIAHKLAALLAPAKSGLAGPEKSLRH